MDKAKNLYDMEAEKSILATMLLLPGTTPKLRGRLEAKDFSRYEYGHLYGAMQELFTRQKGYDWISLKTYLREQKLNLGKAVDEIRECSAANEGDLMTHAKTVRLYSIRRQGATLLRAASERMLSDFSSTPQDILSKTQIGIIDAQKNSGGEKTKQEVGLAYIEYFWNRRAGKLHYLLTGFRGYDRLAGGLRPGQLITLAANTGCGKTALAQTIALNVCRAGGKVLYASLEMSENEFLDRALSIETGIEQEKIVATNPRTSERENSQVINAIEKITQQYALKVVSKGTLTVSDIVAEAVSYKALHDGLDLVVVDYLQILADDTGEKMRVISLDKMSQRLKAAAMDLQTPIIILSQLSRDIDKRDNKVPVLSDIRESGGIANNSDVVGLLYRPGYGEDTAATDDRACLKLAKTRGFPNGVVWLRWNGPAMRYEDGEPFSLADKDPSHSESSKDRPPEPQKQKPTQYTFAQAARVGKHLANIYPKTPTDADVPPEEPEEDPPDKPEK